MFCAVLPPGQLLLTICTMMNASLLVQPYVLCSSPSWSTSVDNVYHDECLALSSAICFVQFSLLVNFCWQCTMMNASLLLTMCTMMNALLLVQPYVLCSSPSWSTSVDNVYHGECLALSSAICFVQFSLLVNFCWQCVPWWMPVQCLALSSAICFVQFSLLVNFCWQCVPWWMPCS